MTQTIERVELPADTYHALEQIAAFQGVTLAAMIETWIEQHRANENRQALRREYQELISKDLGRTLTKAEEARLDTICDELNALGRQSEAGRALQETNRRGDALIAKSEALLLRVEASAQGKA